MEDAEAVVGYFEIVRTATDMEYAKALEYARDIRVISRLHPKFQARIDSYRAKRDPAGGKR